MSRSTNVRPRMAADPRLIPGVYNYCDRWCERCPLTSRCLVFAGTGTKGEAPDGQNPFAQAGRLGDAMELLQEAAADLGVSLFTHPSPAAHSEAEAVRTLIREHPLMDHARHYAGLAEMWLTGHTEAVAAPGAIGPVETIRWYQLQIGAKVYRALGAMASNRDDPERAPQSDGNGSAKVALIGIDASARAWFDLLAFSPQSDDAAAVLERLHRLREEIEQAFPHARAFVRPGFDTGDVPWPEDLPAWPPAA